MEKWMEALIFLTALLIIVREYFMLSGNKTYMKYTGWWLRLSIVLLAYPNILVMLLLSILLFTGYNIACALALKQKWYYLGTTSITDRWGKVNYALQILLILITIIYTIWLI